MRLRHIDQLLRPPGPQPALPPTMTPLEAQLFDLARIVHKAAEGLDASGPVLQRGFVYPSLVGACCEVAP